jgi:hypothetical protein
MAVYFCATNGISILSALALDNNQRAGSMKSVGFVRVEKALRQSTLRFYYILEFILSQDMRISFPIQDPNIPTSNLT